MGNNTIRNDFYRSAKNNLANFLTLVKSTSKDPRIEEAYESVSDEIRKGRSFSEMVIDDLMAAYETIVGNDGKNDMPAMLYGSLLTKRDGRRYTPDQVKECLKANIEQKGESESPSDSTLPDFMRFLEEFVAHDTMDVAAPLVTQWTDVILDFGKLNNTDDALLLNARAETIQKNSLNFLKELFDSLDEGDELAVFEERLKTLPLPPEARDRASRELKRFGRMDPESSEYGTTADYLDLLASLPWGKMSETNHSLQKAAAILDEDHYGMEEVKKAILEHIAVQIRTGHSGGQILCLAGPPGIGKTSLAQSIARATQREFSSISLSGVSDQSQIRGHRKAYVGSMPGDLIDAIRKAGTDNPVILLDEIDKTVSSPNGNPAAALLEALDPRQNISFKDHYLEFGYNLSKVMFVCTANELGDIPTPLRDRMEIIELPSYSREEKLKIAKQYLVPRQIKKSGLGEDEITFDDSALRKLIEEYTMEAGVRNIERSIGQICGKIVMQFAMANDNAKADPKGRIHITAENLSEYAGSPPISPVHIPHEDETGSVTGLAWTEIGGVPLMIQVVTTKHDGSDLLVATGNLGKTIKESVTDALGMIKSRAAQFGIHEDVLKRKQLHVHFPESMEKDGPSAGLAIATAIISELTGIKVNRKVAMTGAIDIKGNAWEIGGLREKLEGAHRVGAEIVIIPKANEKDLAKIPASIKEGLTIIPVSRIEEVLKIALVEELKPIVTEPPIDNDRQGYVSETVFDQMTVLFNYLVQKMSPANENKQTQGEPQKKLKPGGMDPS